MAKHNFARTALRDLNHVHELMVFALNVPMTSADREEVRSLLHKTAEIINKY